MKLDLALGLEVLADILENPTFPEKEVELEKAAQIAAIKAEDEQITSVARNVLREKLFDKHPYALRTSGRVEAIQKLSPQLTRPAEPRFAFVSRTSLIILRAVCLAVLSSFSNWSLMWQ